MKTAVCCNQSSFDNGHVCFGFCSTNSTTSSPSDPVTERILMALSGVATIPITTPVNNNITTSQDRADSVVPHSGKADSLKAVFIKSTTEDDKKMESIIESTDESMGIVKSAPMEVCDRNLTMAASLATFTPPPAQASAAPSGPCAPCGPGGVKSPVGVRKFQFHGLFSFFYNNPNQPGESLKEEEHYSGDVDMTDGDSIEVEEIDLKKQPAKSILKPAKQVGDLTTLPPPILKSVFLRQEELSRMTHFNHSMRHRHHLSHSRESHHHVHATTNQSDLQKTKGSIPASSMPNLSGSRRLQFTLDRSTIHEAWHRADYERGGVEYIAKALTPEIANLIKRELNEVKREMDVHEDSRHYTQFYPVR